MAERLRQNNLKVKIAKCLFASNKIEYLSHIVTEGTLAPNPLKTSAVGEYQRPKTVKQF